MSKKNIFIQCNKCKGSGFQKRKSIFTCFSCGTKGNCMHCENIKYKGPYEECDKCLGCGEIYFNKKINKTTSKHLHATLIK